MTRNTAGAVPPPGVLAANGSAAAPAHSAGVTTPSMVAVPSPINETPPRCPAALPASKAVVLTSSNPSILIRRVWQALPQNQAAGRVSSAHDRLAARERCGRRAPRRHRDADHRPRL